MMATIVHSALYEGSVRHRRHHPRENHFTYTHGMLYLDLDELPALLEREPLYSDGRANLAWFRRADYLGPRALPLKQAVHAFVAKASGLQLTGPVRMLTQVRMLGYVFNPVTFYYCFDKAGETLDAVVAEITNTPWHERHAYVLTRISAEVSGDVQRFRFAKQFHVSPFLPMEILHDWRFSTPGEVIRVHMEDVQDGRTVLDATLSMKRHPLGKYTLTATLLKHPLRTFKVTAGIYFQALRLWWKRIPFHPHPDRADVHEKGIAHDHRERTLFAGTEHPRADAEGSARGSHGMAAAGRPSPRPEPASSAAGRHAVDP